MLALCNPLMSKPAVRKEENWNCEVLNGASSKATLQRKPIIRRICGFVPSKFVFWPNYLHTTVAQQGCPFDPLPPDDCSCHCAQAPDQEIKRQRNP